MKQKMLYEPIKNWLESKGFEALITGDKSEVVIPIRDLAPMAYKIPDLIGVNDSKQVIYNGLSYSDQKWSQNKVCFLRI